jgi:hypothetical protein
MALATYPDVFATCRVVLYCDNAATVAWVSKGAPGQWRLVALSRGCCPYVSSLHVRLHVLPIEGAANVLADAVSRRSGPSLGQAGCGPAVPFPLPAAGVAFL